MRICWLAIIAALSVSSYADAQASPPAEELCRDAIGTVNPGGVPPRLLHAIGVVESGRPDPRTGAIDPWPWTINVAGQGYVFNSKQDAIAAVKALLAKNVNSIDVGCMQINLMHHPTAFASLEEAFDPIANVRYAVRFLSLLFAQTGNWADAAALYHSATPGIAGPYRHKVLVLWTGSRSATLPGTPQARLAAAWAATVAPAESPHASWGAVSAHARRARAGR